MREELAKGGPAACTRKKAKQREDFGTNSEIKLPKTGRLHSPCESSPYCTITVCQEKFYVDAIGRCDDGSEDSLASPRVAEAVVIKGIVRITPIDKVNI